MCENTEKTEIAARKREIDGQRERDSEIESKRTEKEEASLACCSVEETEIEIE